MRELRFEVVGVAQTKGSARAYTVRRTRPNGSAYVGARVENDNTKAKGWAATIAHCAALELRRPEHRGLFFTGPIAVEVTFYLPRPKRFATPKWAATNVPHVTKPDTDKLVRCAKDALTKLVYHDDSQVTDLIARKRYVEAGGFPRAVIVVRQAIAEATGPADRQRLNDHSDQETSTTLGVRGERG